MSAELLKEFEKMQVLVKSYRDENEAMKEKDILSETKMAKMETALEDIMKKYNELCEKANHVPTMGFDGKPRTKAQETHAKAFGEYIQKGYKFLSPEFAKALVEDTSGMYLVPEDLERVIYRDLPEITIMRNLATVMKVRSPELSRRTLTDFAVGWGVLETRADLTETNTTPGSAKQYIEDCYALTKVGKNELMDSFVNLEREMTRMFAEAIAESEDSKFMVGEGHDENEPEGIFDSSSGITVVRTASATALTFDDVYNLTYALPAKYRARKPSFLMNSATELVLIKLRAGGSTTGDGAYIWKPAISPGLPNTINGFSVHNQDDIESTLAIDNRTMAFGDWKSAYRILDREGMTIQRLTEQYATQGQMGFLVKKRVTGGLIRVNAARILQQKAT